MDAFYNSLSYLYDIFDHKVARRIFVSLALPATILMGRINPDSLAYSVINSLMSILACYAIFTYVLDILMCVIELMQNRQQRIH